MNNPDCNRPKTGMVAAQQWLQRGASGLRASDHAPDLRPAWNQIKVAANREAKTLQSASPEMFPHFTNDSRWEMLDVNTMSKIVNHRYEHGNWTAGFSIGLLWLSALDEGITADGEDEVRERTARQRLTVLASRADDHMTHDLGFLFYPSYALGHLLGHLMAREAEPAMRAARQLAHRYNSRTQMLQAFGPIGHPDLAGTSTIDTMMNLPLLFWAAAHGGDPLLLDIARRHARNSARLYFRPDGSTYHLLSLDPISGALLRRGTFQGAGDESCWSRGQAWATCGFAWAYAAIGEQEMLDAAERAAAYFFDRLPENAIPPWDFTTDCAEAIHDASASAVVALGCLILTEFHPDHEARAIYQKAGLTILEALSESCLNQKNDRAGVLQHSCYSKPHNLGVDAATAWGDFLFFLAIALGAGKLPVSALFNKVSD